MLIVEAFSSPEQKWAFIFQEHRAPNYKKTSTLKKGVRGLAAWRIFRVGVYLSDTGTQDDGGAWTPREKGLASRRGLQCDDGCERAAALSDE